MFRKFHPTMLSRQLTVLNENKSQRVVEAVTYGQSYSVYHNQMNHAKRGQKNTAKIEVTKTSASVYVHWPYCRRRCTYCNFNKYIDKSVDHGRMRRNLVTEAERLLNLSGVTQVSSVFFGGGTPSLAEPSTLEAVLNCVSQQTELARDAEVSMEVNPTALEEAKLREFRDAGINRVSIGVQTLSSPGLHILGRDHSPEDSLRTLETARALFPGHVSVDLIFGWPGQDLEGWAEELTQILPLCDNHISLYQLTLERGTQLFKQVHSKKLVMPSRDVSEDMYLQAIQILSDFGFERYEVSNFAKESCYSSHNVSYWMGHQYIGIGPGAHGRFKPLGGEVREARIQTLEPRDWMWEVEHHGHATRKQAAISVQEQREELLITALRTKWGLSQQLWQSVAPESSLAQVFGHTAQLHKDLLQLDTRGLRATSKGLNVLDSLLSDLLLDLQRHFK